MKRKIVIEVSLTYLPNLGGLETHLNDLITILSKYYDVVLLTMQPFGNKKLPFIEKEQNVTILRFPRFSFLPSYIQQYANYAIMPLYVTLWFLINKKEYKKEYKKVVFHLNGLVLSPLCAILKMFRMKCIFSDHFTYRGTNKLINTLIKWGLAKADCILTLSYLEKINLIKIGVPREKIKKFTHWVDLKTFKPISKKVAREKLRLDERKFIVLFVGRLVKVKGIDIILELASMMSDIEFYIAGDGPLKEKVEKATIKNKNLHYIGKISVDLLSIWYNAADLLIIPSIYDEGFGRVIIEALACGTPVVGSKRGGIPEAITPQVGKVVEPTPQEFAKAIREIIALNYSKTELREYAVKRFGIQNAETILKCLF
ncbi:MAG: glycosyltransferase family 4 protein [Infirmifilum sp.]